MGQYLLQAVKKGPAATAGQEGAAGGITYELYCREDGDKTASSGELQELAERLSKLESAIGVKELRSGVSWGFRQGELSHRTMIKSFCYTLYMHPYNVQYRGTSL